MYHCRGTPPRDHPPPCMLRPETVVAVDGLVAPDDKTPTAHYCIQLLHSRQSRQRPQPNPRTLDEYTPRQYWSANFILVIKTGQQIYISNTHMHTQAGGEDPQLP